MTELQAQTIQTEPQPSYQPSFFGGMGVMGFLAILSFIAREIRWHRVHGKVQKERDHYREESLRPRARQETAPDVEIVGMPSWGPRARNEFGRDTPPDAMIPDSDDSVESDDFGSKSTPPRHRRNDR